MGGQALHRLSYLQNPTCDCHDGSDMDPTLVLHHSVIHSQQKRCPQGVEVECLRSSKQRMQRVGEDLDFWVSCGLKK